MSFSEPQSRPRPWLSLVPLLMKMFDEEEVKKEPPGLLFWPTYPGHREVPNFVHEYNEKVLSEKKVTWVHFLS